MRIGIDASRANQTKRTGTEWYSYYLIQELAKIDVKNLYLLYTEEPLRGDFLNLGENFESRVLSWSLPRFWHQGRLSLEMLRHRPDVLFIPAHTIPLIHPKKTVTVIHDLGFERYPELYSRSELLYHGWAAKFSLKHASKVIAVSEFTKQEIIDIYGVEPSKVRVIYHGLASKQYRIIKDKHKVEERIAKYLPQRRQYLLTIGRLEEKKNILGLVEAFRLLKQKYSHKLLLVGPRGYGYDKILTLIRKHHLENDVIRPGYVPEEDLPYLLAGAQVFVFPSFYEGFGLPLLQAMASGVPIVASRVASIPEIVDGAALLVDPTKPKEIAQAIGEALEDERLRASLIQRGLKRVKDFSWQKCASETLDLLTHLA